MFTTELVSEIDNMLYSMSEEKLAQYKAELCKECQDLSKEYIEWSDDKPPEWKESIKGSYEMKMQLIKRCIVIENMHANQTSN